MDKNTTIVNIYIEQKASAEELELFEKSISERRTKLGVEAKRRTPRKYTFSNVEMYAIYNLFMHNNVNECIGRIAQDPNMGMSLTEASEFVTTLRKNFDLVRMHHSYTSNSKDIFTQAFAITERELLAEVLKKEASNHVAMGIHGGSAGLSVDQIKRYKALKAGSERQNMINQLERRVELGLPKESPKNDTTEKGWFSRLKSNFKL